MTMFPPPPDDAALRFLGSGSEMRDMVRAFDWSSTPLGPISQWPASLKTATGIMLNAVQPMVLWWGDALVQIYNDAFVPAFGIGRHPGALGQRAASFWDDTWPVIGPQAMAVLKGGAATWYEDNRLPMVRGGRVEECYWSYTFTPVFDEDGNIRGVLVMSQETTSRVLAERRRLALDRLSAGMVSCGTIDEVWQHVQQAAAAAPNDIRAVRMGSAGAGDDAAGWVSVAAADLGLPAALVLRFEVSAALPFDQLYAQFLEQFTRIAGAACTRIEREQAQAIATAERNRLLLDAPVGAAVMTGEDLTYTVVNSLYATITGRAVDSIVGKPFTEVFPELVDSTVHNTFLAVYEAGLPYISDETLVPLHRNGGELEDRYFTYNLSPLRRLDGAVYGLMVIAVDITQQVQARAEIEHLNTELNEAARAKDEFLALLGHELRNPLAPIVTALELMKLRDTGSAREQGVIRRQVTHLTRLVDDLLDVSRITRGKVELRKARASLREVLDKAVEMASSLIEQKKQHLRVDIEETEWYGDPARLAQVVSNLLTNAARYTPENGHIAVAAHVRGGEIVLEVSDDGIGIAPALLPHIFEAFVQGERRLDGSVGGLGIGLALVRNLVELHGGQASAYSAGQGQGSTFTITLPLAAHLQDDEAGARAADAAAVRQHILVVDDNHDAADFLAELLRAQHHQVSVAYDPAQALQLAAGAMPAVAVLDIGLPGMSGYELAGHLRRMPGGGALACIAVTGYGQEDDKLRSRAAGFAGHLVKPIDMRELEALLGASPVQDN
ncbi:ATP-binding protein [Massilia sp. GCM10020059]|uniref:histidine kinase n=1 Tax=Massilia agrisoli TaxID=2892444 RepID=A0ABS8INH3_9BURK|nr:ATP-binding protein [Massilia agrisoli]MCC6070029.1 PAS domain-containing protein [Massilia agrisoli]